MYVLDALCWLRWLMCWLHCVFAVRALDAVVGAVCVSGARAGCFVLAALVDVLAALCVCGARAGCPKGQKIELDKP